MKQIQEVLSSQELVRSLAGQPIENISNVSNSSKPLTFSISTVDCLTEVSLEAHAPEHPGPTTYSIKTVGTPICNH